MKKYYQQLLYETFQHVDSSKDGLSNQVVQARLQKNGQNKLASKKRKSVWQMFLDQFKDFMIIILLVAAVISGLLLQEWTDAIIIMAVVVISAVTGVVQEYKTANAIDSLKSMSTPETNVRRDGKIVTVPSTQLVVGDVVMFEAGDIIPADLRIIKAHSLKMEESSLTGESVAVDKQVKAVAKNAPLAEQADMAFMNSNVTYGTGEGVVVATGMNTQVGHIATMLDQTPSTRTPLQDNLDALSKTISWVILVIAVIIFVVGLFNEDQSLPLMQRISEMLLTAISMAIAAIPEGLPAIVTVILALGTRAMARHHALIRKLPAVETLGSTDIIASDKTGTLTQNKMTVEKIYYDGQMHDANEKINLDNPTLRVMMLANDSQMDKSGKLLGDPTETALIDYGQKHDLPWQDVKAKNPRINSIPFDSERKLMSAIVQDGPQFMVTTKGALDQIIDRCRYVLVNGKREELTKERKQHLLDVNTDLAKHALRVLGMAYRQLETKPTKIDSKNLENDMTFTGLIGMIDPERPEVKQAIEEAQHAGIKTIMITGDHPVTAKAIAQRLNIVQSDDDQVVTGAQLDKLSDKKLIDEVPKISVYARVAPEHKVRIVKAWQARGKVVAMTGDGVNDAPALSNADVGIGMGITGTEVTKNASDMVLADDNFSTIVDAVKQGRKVFRNIQKAIQYLLSCNIGEVLTVFAMTMFSWDLLKPVQILWINLVTDTFPAIALGVDPIEPHIMDQPPRGRKSNFFTGGVGIAIIYQGLIEAALVIGVYLLGITFPVHSGYHAMHADALTMAYVTLGMLQFFQAFNVKSVHGTMFHVNTFQNKIFNWSILFSGLMLAITILIPQLNPLFHVTELNNLQWSMVFGCGFLMIAIVELVKWGQRIYYRRKSVRNTD